MTALTKPDLYTKVILTVIAACLVWLCVSNVNFVSPAQAQGAGIPGQVTIVGISKEVVLPVGIAATKSPVPVKFEGTMPVKVTAIKRDPKEWDALKIEQGAKP
jgi:hypothetical protein